MDKNGNLQISNFQAGVADSPLLGFAKMANVEVFEKQGVAKIQFGTKLKYSPASLPVSIVRDNYGNEYVGCEGGQFYVNGTLKGSGQAIYDMKIISDLSNPAGTVGTISYSGKTLNDLVGSGTFSGSVSTIYTITLTTSGTPDTFNWSDSNGNSASGVAITGSAQSLSTGISIKFSVTTGHTVGDVWMFTVSSTSNTSYLLISRQTDLAIWGPIGSGGASLFSGWNGGFSSPLFASGYAKPIIVGQDNIVYIGNGGFVASFPLSHFAAQVDGVTPLLTGSGINTAALTLAQGHYVRSMAELGKWLMVGSQGGSSIYDSVNVKLGRIFPWDRTSPTFNLPVIFNENGINSMLQVGNILYISAGTRGRIYYTDSTNYTQIKRLPFTTNRQFGAVLFGYPNAMQFHNGELLTGASTGADTYPSKSLMGVYSMFLTPIQIGNTIIQYPVVMRNSPSTLSVGSTQVLKIGAILSTSNDQLYIGWQDGSTYGVDVLDSTLYSSYSSFIETQFYTVGSVLDKKTFKNMEISLTNPLIAGQQIRISWRGNLNDSWTSLGTFDSTNFGTNNTFRTLANLASLVKLQLKIELNQATTVAFGNNIELEYISLTGGSK